MARVKGFLDDVKFTEGDLIKDGAPLYKIEPGLFQAAVEQAQGALERSKAAKTLTEIQLQRAQELLTRQAGTVVARDQELAADQQAQGQILPTRPIWTPRISTSATPTSRRRSPERSAGPTLPKAMWSAPRPDR